MAEQIQGKDVIVRLFVAGQLSATFPATKFEDMADDEIRKRELLGTDRSKLSHLVHGYNGTIEFDVSNDDHVRVASFLDQRALDGLAYSVRIDVTLNFRGGGSSSYSYPDARLRIPKMTVGGRREDLTGVYEWGAESRI